MLRPPMSNGPFASDGPKAISLTPLLTEWEVQGKHGNGWINKFGSYSALSDLDAARKFKRLHGYKTVRVRSAELGGKWRIIRFVPTPVS